MQTKKGMPAKIRPHVLIKKIEDSKIPLGEEDHKLHSIKTKVEHDEPLSKADEAFLLRLVERAGQWQKGVTSSSDTDPEDTMSG
jgi:hypothetical protein